MAKFDAASGSVEARRRAIGARRYALRGSLQHEVLISVMIANYCIKVGWEVVATPITYRLVAVLKRVEREDFYDVNTNFTPFSLETPGR